MLRPPKPVLRLAVVLIVLGTFIGLTASPLGGRAPYADERDEEREASRGADPAGRYVWCAATPIHR